jgi:hypothetical protein
MVVGTLMKNMRITFAPFAKILVITLDFIGGARQEVVYIAHRIS